jgi:uncharacterized protein YqgC (DUF456 family)
MPTDPDFWAQVIIESATLFVLVIGMAGLIVPVFPGLTVMWLATLFYAVLENADGRMGWIDWTLFALITILMLVGNIIDNIIIARKMRGHAIPWTSIGISYAAGIAGSVLGTPLIGLAASPLALFGAEFLRLRDRRAAFATAKAYMIGWGAAFGLRFIIGLVMTGLWMLWAWL